MPQEEWRKTETNSMIQISRMPNDLPNNVKAAENTTLQPSSSVLMPPINHTLRASQARLAGQHHRGRGGAITMVGKRKSDMGLYGYPQS